MVMYMLLLPVLSEKGLNVMNNKTSCILGGTSCKKLRKQSGKMSVVL